MNKKQAIALIVLNCFALLGAIAWSISQPSYEPFITSLVLAGSLIGISVKKSKVPPANETEKNGQEMHHKKDTEINHEKQETTDQENNDIESKNITKVKSFPNSTTFFSDRFSSAFPGIRGVTWFENQNEAIQRLSKLLEPPLVFELKDGTSRHHPVWWWRFGNNHIESFEVLSKDTILLDCYELKIDKIAAVNAGSYYQCFIYLQAKAMEPIGLYEHDKESIESAVDQIGYSTEEYAIMNNTHLVTRAEYDDAAAFRNGELIQSDGNSKSRVRYITPYNILIAAHGSPINNSNFDLTLKQKMNGILRGESTLEELIEEILTLPKREKFG